jgi:hypothetical protein
MTGGQIKACRDVLKIAVVVPEFGLDKIWLLRIPPASLRNFQAYAATFEGVMIPEENREAHMGDYATIVYFEPGKQGIINFMPDQLQEGEAGLADWVFNNNAASDVLGLDKIQEDRVQLPAPEQKKQIAAPAKPKLAIENKQQEVIPPKKPATSVKPAMSIKPKVVEVEDDEEETSDEDAVLAAKAAAIRNAGRPSVKPAVSSIKAKPVVPAAKPSVKPSIKPAVAPAAKPAAKPGFSIKPTTKADAPAGIPSTNLPESLKNMLGNIMGMETT